MKRPILRRIFAVLLMLVGAGGLFTVTWPLPWLVRELDHDWAGQHSEQAQWEATQGRIRFLGWWHDDFGPVGSYGDKAWAEWIMERMVQEGGQGQGECEIGHKDVAMEQITNFSPHLDDSLPRKPWKEELPQWLAWWEKNRHKTQQEWMIDGFAAVGVNIHNPPVKEDWPALLKVLGYENPKFAKGKYEPGRRQPGYLYQNAVRCLRDSGFNAVKFALEEEITPELKAGLLYYSDRQSNADDAWSARPGRLFGSRVISAYRFEPELLKPELRWAWGFASTFILVAGLWLWRSPPRWVRALWKGLLPDG